MLSDFHFKLSLRTVSALGVAVAIGLGGLIVCAVDSVREDHRQAQDAHLFVERASNMLAEHIDASLRDIGRDLSLAAQNALFGQPEDQAAIQSYLDGWRKLRPEYADVLFADRAGRIRATASGLHVESNVSGSSWFPKALTALAVGDASENIKAGTEAPHNIIVGAPVSPVGSAARGVLALQLNTSWADAVVRGVRHDLEGVGGKLSFTIMNANGQTIHTSGALGRDIQDIKIVEASTPMGDSDHPGLGWLVIARSNADLLTSANQNSFALPLIASLMLIGGALGWLAGRSLSRRIAPMIGEAPEAAAQPAKSVWISELQKLTDATRAASAQTEVRERLLQDTKTALVRTRERLRAFETMAGWSCWEVDLANSQVTWTDPSAPIVPSATERAMSLDEVMDRLEPHDRELLHVAMRTAMASGVTQDVTLRTLPFDGEPAGRRLLLRMAPGSEGNEPVSRLHILSREVGSVAIVGSSPIASPLAAGPADPAVERREDKIRRQITDGIVHDINDALSVIMTALGTLKLNGGVIADQALHAIETALRGAERGASLTRRVTSLTRRDASAVAETDVARVMKDLTDYLRSLVAGHSIVVSMEVDLPAILCSERQFEVSLLNLMFDTKARLPESDASISIGIDKVTPSQEKGLLGGRASVRVLFSAPVDLSGGDGVQSVRTLLKQVGGLIDVKTSAQESNITLWFPAAEAQAAKLPSDAAEFRPLNVLFVEADALLRSTAVEALTKLGHAVTQAASGIQAMEILAQRRDFDVMVADYANPMMNGLQLAAVLSRTHPLMRIVLSGPRGHFPENAKIFAHLYKPFGPLEIAEVLREGCGDLTSAKRHSAA